MTQDFEARYEELLQFLYRTPWGLLQTARNGDIQMLNPVAAKLLMPLAFNGRLDNLFDLLRTGRPELQALVAASTQPYCVVCEDLPLPDLQSHAPGPGEATHRVSISIFVQNPDCLMVVLRESQLVERNSSASQQAELHALQNLDALGLIKTRAGIIRWSNPAAQRMLGYLDKQLLNAPFTDLLAQDAGELLMEICQATVMAGATYASRATLLPGTADTVTLALTATSTAYAEQEILWTLMEVHTT